MATEQTPAALLANLAVGAQIKVLAHGCRAVSVTIDELTADGAKCSRWDDVNEEWWTLDLPVIDGALCWNTCHRPVISLSVA